MATNDIAALTSTQISAITTEDLRALTGAQLTAMGTADFNAMGTTQFAALTSGQINGLSTAMIAAMETSDIAAFTTAGIRGLTTAQIQAFTTTQIQALETSDIAAMTTSQVQGFETADIQAMSSAQLSALLSVTPVVLDLDGNGVSTSAAGQGARFDLTGTGQSREVGWTAGGDGLLAMDRNGNGVIDDGRELFGAVTPMADGRRAGHGFNALAELDSNGDGVVNASDAHFGDLKVWVDADHDGRTDVGELRGLVELGITGLNLAHAASDRIDNGNAVGLVGSYTTADGATHEMADVWLARKATDLPAADELLTAAPAALPGASDTSAASAGAGAVAAAMPQRGTLDEELMRHNGTLL
jgi:hypothetical protein